MTDEYTVCASAFFRNKGKNVISETEFLMAISLDFHWMPYGKAKELLAILLSKKILVKNGDLLKPTFEISEIEVPVAYRPSESLIASLSKTQTEKKEVKTAGNDLLPAMIAEAAGKGMEKRIFISEANSLSKKLGVDMLAAALIILRDEGVDITSYADRVYEELSEK
ncbi:MAG: DUF2240 family protein [Candidatus Methanomethylophilaceae archaeon]|nr:DUF2240 family protein [Candidatus Methanomethylophilaceae archaeon]